MNATLEDLIQPQDRIILRIERLSDDGKTMIVAHAYISGQALKQCSIDIPSILELQLNDAYQQLPKESC